MLIVLLLAVSAVDANDDPAAGIWLGFTEGYGAFFRLDLREGGSGLLATTARPGDELGVYLYHVRSWSVNGTKVKLKLEPSTEETPPLKLDGKLGRREMTLDIARGVNRHKLRLYREARIVEELERVRERMEAAGKAP
jgi:hypothetical protein